MSFFHKIKTFFYARSELTQQTDPKNDEGVQKITHQLTAAECQEVAGGPQVRNELDIR